MTPDLNEMSLPDLKQLHRNIAKTIAGYDARKKAEALAVLDAKAKELGFSLSELAGTVTGRKRGAGVPKYRHPANPAITWTGRGRRPQWLVEHIAAGKAIEDL